MNRRFVVHKAYPTLYAMRPKKQAVVWTLADPHGYAYETTHLRQFVAARPRDFPDADAAIAGFEEIIQRRAHGERKGLTLDNGWTAARRSDLRDLARAIAQVNRPEPKPYNCRDSTVCSVCGRPLPSRKRRYCSVECSRYSWAHTPRNNTGMPRGNPEHKWLTHCIDCGTLIYRGTHCIRCEECQRKSNNARVKNHIKKGARRPLGSTDYCKRCGEPYMVQSGTQKYCSQCQEQARLDAFAEATRKYHARPEIAKKEQERQRTIRQTKLCAYCGKPFTPGTAAIYCSQECREKGKRLKKKESKERRKKK